ncbi:MAG TPA: 2-dehydropantoate 2-reductase, partial [Bacillota bacterium]
MRVAVMGAGAIGGYYGALLQQAGHEVVFIARGEHLKAMQQRGLIIDSVHGSFHLMPVEATGDTAKVGPVDLVLFCVKSQDTRAAAEQCRPLVGAATAVLTLQNGVENDSVLAEVLGPDRVLVGACRISATIREPGVIHQPSPFRHITFAERDGRRSARAEAILGAFQEAGIPAEIGDDPRRVLWDKFLFLAPLAGVTAVTLAPVGIVRDTPEAWDMLVEAVAEVERVGRAQGVALPPDAVDRTLEAIRRAPADMKSSLQQDREKGRYLEVDALSGAVVRLGTQV